MSDTYKKNLEENTGFYLYLKRIYSAEYKLDTKLIQFLLQNLYSQIKKQSVDKMKELFCSVLESKLTGKKKESKMMEYERISALWKSDKDVKLFFLALSFIYVKNMIHDDLKGLIKEIKPAGHPLSIEYDNVSVNMAYKKRALGLLSCSSICDFYLGISKDKPSILRNIDSDTEKIVQTLSKELSSNVNIKSMFGIIMNESINQSIVSTAGGGYEDRIYNMLLALGIPDNKITRFNHDETGSVEHDFIFEFEKRKYGISAKRTLRERYKQYVNLLENKNADILLTITFGTDLTPAKAKTIRGFGVNIFIAPEIYNSQANLRSIDGVFSVNDFTEKTLRLLK